MTINIYISNSFCGSGIQEWLSWVALAQNFSWGCSPLKAYWCWRSHFRGRSLTWCWLLPESLSSSPWAARASSWHDGCWAPSQWPSEQDGRCRAVYDLASEVTLSHSCTACWLHRQPSKHERQQAWIPGHHLGAGHCIRRKLFSFPFFFFLSFFFKLW